MKFSLLGAIALVTGIAVGSADAADLAARPFTKAPPPVAVPFTWTGFYAGVQGGYQWSRDRVTEFETATGVATGFGRDFKPTGGFGGLHAGYNYQFNWLVLGIEGDVDFGRVSDGFSTAFGLIYDARKNWEASVRGRLGVTPVDRLLLYVTGGVAFTELKYHWETPPLFGIPPADASISTTGWTAGGGAEVALTNYLTARVEYRYSDFGTTRFDWPAIGGCYEQKPRFQSVRGGISFRF